MGGAYHVGLRLLDKIHHNHKEAELALHKMWRGIQQDQLHLHNAQLLHKMLEDAGQLQGGETGEQQCVEAELVNHLKLVLGEGAVRQVDHHNVG